MRVLRAVVVLGLAAGMLGACSGDSQSSLPKPSRAFCQAAYDYDTNLAKLQGKPRKQTELVQKLADHAPTDITKDAQLYLDAMKRAIAGDDSVKDNPKVESAVKNVERRAIQGCKLLEQNQDGSSGI